MSDRWLRYLDFWRRDPRRDVDEEIRFHIESRIDDLIEHGLSPEDARRRAAAEFGDPLRVRDQTVAIDERMLRRRDRTEWLSDLWRDARVGARGLRRSPGFAITAIICAALGIGVTSAILSATWAILVRPLPYPNADRLVAVYSENTVRGYHGTNISWPDYVSWRDGTRAFASLGLWTWTSYTLSDEENEAERVDGSAITANLFPTLEVRPIMGRNFATEENTDGRQYVVLLSYRVWQARFAGDRGIVGKQITVDGRPYTVIGVMPRGFNFPLRGDLWVPFVPDPRGERHENRGYAGAIGRLKPGVSIEQARSDLHAIDAELVREFPDENYGWRAELTSLRDDLVGDLERPLKVFLGAVALVLLLVCANLANLMLARGTMRAREIAIRSALGASRRRITRQLLTESLLVALLGGTVGIAVAWWGIRLLRFAFPDQTPPFFISLSLDAPTVGMTVAVTLLTGLLFGAMPAMRTTRFDVTSTLRDGSRGGGSSVRRARLRDALVVGELAMSVVLMVGAFLLVRSYRNLEGTSLGFDEQGILSARLTLSTARYPSRAQAKVFYDRLFERLRTLPGVTVVGSAQGIPFSGWDLQSEAEIEGAPAPKRGEELETHYQYVTPDYFKAIGVSLIRGRWFDASDRDSLNPVVLVNQQMVAQGFGGRNPIGQRLRVGGESEPWATIVGVVHDFRHYRLPQPMGPAVYYPYAIFPARQQTVVLRTTRDDPRSLVPALRAAVHELDPQVALYQVQTFDEVVSRSLWRQRLQGHVLSVFAALALGLSCIGLYGVISYAVAQRTRELGVRLALGATRRDVLLLVVGQSARVVLLGVAIGLAVAYFSARVLEALLYGVQPNDLATFTMVPGVLAIVALIATLIPARRATRVDPIIAMRAE